MPAAISTDSVASVEWRVANVAKADSVVIHDSVFVRIRADTVEVVKWRTVFRDRVINNRDTIVKTDIRYIREPYEVEVVRYKVPPWAWWLLGIVLLYILLKICLRILSKYLHRW